MMKTKSKGFCPQQGFSLTEVLVSILVLSIGLLGLAGVQTAAYRVNHDSFVRSTAVSQIDAIVDRIRANKQGRQSGFYNDMNPDNQNQGLPGGALGGKGNALECDECSPEELAKIDYNNWNLENKSLLPNGRGTVTGNGQVFTITVMYDKHRTGATGTNCSGNRNVDLTCIRVNVEL